ncbi:50S ribosomal protein L29 [Candidatus Gottesmanbacteria bacterium]|nr:50S ribosomal protein L29 [Candidatus Gottesmanbacteria bacterium]
MKPKEKQSLHSMSEAELIKHISDLEAEVTKGMLDRTTKQVKNTRLFWARRQHIAVAKTVLRERALI